MASTEYSEPLPTYSKNILYPQLYEKLKTNKNVNGHFTL